jgi:hypothetical protein
MNLLTIGHQPLTIIKVLTRNVKPVTMEGRQKWSYHIATAKGVKDGKLVHRSDQPFDVVQFSLHSKR